MIPFTIALPAGRLADETIAFFSQCGIANFSVSKSDRSLSFFDETGEYRIILVRSQDVPTCVLQGGADAGITGRDVLAERRYDLTVPLELGFGRCRLSLAAPSKTAGEVRKKNHLRVATKYPRLAMDYFFSHGRSCEIIKMHGSVEIAPILEMSDCIVDLVSTGSTLKANGLEEIDIIMESSALLVVNRSAYALQTEKMNTLISRMRAFL